MCADHYMLNDMRQILINNIKIHYECILCRNDEQRNCKATELNNSTNINNTKNYFSPQIIKHVEKLFVVLSEIILFFLFQIYKVFIRTECVGNEILAMEVVDIFLNTYRCGLFVQILIMLLKNSIILLKTKQTRL